ncbi:LLM class flavin-dependent oxidoreductase [Streptomyces sp. EN27]|uniref:LLM class flavin-dependent oxidoreductase n=1 Tax=Streptomyces sp. EN27 TaxID=211464 RepID=UPI00085185DB|nr:LLM class flavin-dependent oxidoreductase [Streptomyces sp. EN27]
MSELRFHWCSPLESGQKKASGQYDAGSLDFDEILSFVKEAEELGVDSLLMAISYHMPDPLPMLGALSHLTDRIKLLLAYRPGLLSPTLFTQVVNTVSWMSDNRISLNLVAGISPAEQAYYGDFLKHDERYERAGEFLEILHELWSENGPVTFEGKHYRIKDAQLGLRHKGGGRPRIYISGASGVAQATAVEHGDCWLRYADTPAEMAKAAQPVLEQGCEVGLRMQVLARATREEALAQVAEMMREPDEKHRKWIADFVANCDSEAVKNSFRLADTSGDDWLSPYLWTGAVAYRGGPALCIVGSYEEVADYIMEYKASGVSEFIFSGWPSREEMRIFYGNVLPLVRAREARLAALDTTVGAPGQVA